jgi:hypothetical protein
MSCDYWRNVGHPRVHAQPLHCIKPRYVRLSARFAVFPQPRRYVLLAADDHNPALAHGLAFSSTAAEGKSSHGCRDSPNPAGRFLRLRPVDYAGWPERRHPDVGRGR